MHYATVYNGKTDPSERVYSSHWMQIIDRLVDLSDLGQDDQEVGYYSPIKDLVEPSEFSQADFAELFQDLDSRTMSRVISFTHHLAKDIELEDEELDVQRHLSLVEPYRYLNIEASLQSLAKHPQN